MLAIFRYLQMMVCVLPACSCSPADTHAALTRRAHEPVLQENSMQQCHCLSACDSTVSATLEAPDPEGPARDLARLGSRSNLLRHGDASARVFRVHLHSAYASGTPTVHLVKIGKRAGVHMCDCLELAHRGLPCRHYFAVLLHDQSIQFDVDAIHPRWLVQSTARSSPEHTTPPLSGLRSTVEGERLRVLQRLSMDAIEKKIEQLSGNVRGLKSKAEYAERLVSLEQAALTAPPDQQASSVISHEAALTEASTAGKDDLMDIGRYVVD